MKMTNLASSSKKLRLWLQLQRRFDWEKRDLTVFYVVNLDF